MRSKHSGVNGVYRSGRKWMAQMSLNGKWKYLGLHNTVEEAAEARRVANAEYGFTERHGTKLAP